MTIHPTSARARLTALLGAGLLLALLTPSAHADWQGKLRQTVRPAEPGARAVQMTGKVQARKQQLRFDYDKPMRLTVLFDFARRKMWTYMPTTGTRMEMDLDKAPSQPGGSQPPAVSGCTGTELEACMARSGFRRVGAEKLQGRDVVVYEATLPGPVTQRVWRVPKIDAPLFLRSRTTDAKGNVVQLDVTGLVEKKLPDAAFAPPTESRKVGGPRAPSPPRVKID